MVGAYPALLITLSQLKKEKDKKDINPSIIVLDACNHTRNSQNSVVQRGSSCQSDFEALGVDLTIPVPRMAHWNYLASNSAYPNLYLPGSLDPLVWLP